MTPAVQHALTLLIVLAAVTYLALLGRRQWRKASALRRSTSCGPGCGCE